MPQWYASLAAPVADTAPPSLAAHLRHVADRLVRHRRSAPPASPSQAPAARVPAAPAGHARALAMSDIPPGRKAGTSTNHLPGAIPHPSKRAASTERACHTPPASPPPYLRHPGSRLSLRPPRPAARHHPAARAARTRLPRPSSWSAPAAAPAVPSRLAPRSISSERNTPPQGQRMRRFPYESKSPTCAGVPAFSAIPAGSRRAPYPQQRWLSAPVYFTRHSAPARHPVPIRCTGGTPRGTAQGISLWSITILRMRQPLRPCCLVIRSTQTGSTRQHSDPSRQPPSLTSSGALCTATLHLGEADERHLGHGLHRRLVEHHQRHVERLHVSPPPPLTPQTARPSCAPSPPPSEPLHILDAQPPPPPCPPSRRQATQCIRPTAPVTARP